MRQENTSIARNNPENAPTVLEPAIWTIAGILVMGRKKISIAQRNGLIRLEMKTNT
jgi:hypothetical protein